MSNIKTKLRKLIETGLLHIFGTSVINKGMSFIMTVVVVRILSKTEYGRFTFAWNIYSMIALLSGFGLSSAIVQLCSEHSSQPILSWGIYRYCVKNGLRFNTILMLLIIGIALLFPLNVPEARPLLLLLSVLPCFSFYYEGTLAYIRSTKNNKLYSKLALLNTVVLFGATIMLIFIFHEYGMILGYIFSYSLSIFTSRKKLGHLSGGYNLTQELRKNAIKIGGISTINNGLSELLYLLDVFIIGLIIADESVIAAYKVATQIPTALSFIPLTLVVYLYPYFAEKRLDKKWCLIHYKITLKAMGFVNLVISGILYILAPFIIKTLYGAEYIDSLTPFRILVVSYFFSGTFRIISGNILVSQQQLKFNLFVTIVSSTTNVVADYFLIKYWGSNGAAIATLVVVIISSVLSTGYLFYYLNKKEK